MEWALNFDEFWSVLLRSVEPLAMFSQNKFVFSLLLKQLSSISHSNAAHLSFFPTNGICLLHRSASCCQVTKALCHKNQARNFCLALDTGQPLGPHKAWATLSTRTRNDTKNKRSKYRKYMQTYANICTYMEIYGNMVMQCYTQHCVTSCNIYILHSSKSDQSFGGLGCQVAVLFVVVWEFSKWRIRKDLYSIKLC